ncbi:MAG: hypothetical protein WKF30_08695 [Pyrinomonadaceae bacterium]
MTVAASKKFAAIGEQVKFNIEARYFFGSPVARADVQYYIYRSRYYPWWWQDEDDSADFGMSSDDEESDGGYYGYGSDMVKEGEGVLDASGRLAVDFEVPQPGEKESWDYTYRLEAQVTDSSRRMIDGRASFTGTRGQIMANARTDRYVYFQGDTAKIVVTSDASVAPASVTLKFWSAGRRLRSRTKTAASTSATNRNSKSASFPRPGLTPTPEAKAATTT